MLRWIEGVETRWIYVGRNGNAKGRKSFRIVWAVGAVVVGAWIYNGWISFGCALLSDSGALLRFGRALVRFGHAFKVISYHRLLIRIRARLGPPVRSDELKRRLLGADRSS